MDSWLVEASDLVRVYGDGAAIRALDGVNLKVARGELVAVMGPSGPKRQAQAANRVINAW